MRTADVDILIVPGLAGGTPEHWYSRWEGKLPTARRVAQEDWHHPDLARWTGQLVAAVEAATKPTILVAHSLGVAFALRLAARAGAAKPYRGAFLAAGFWGTLGLPDYDPINAPFFAPLDWEAARAGCGAGIACYAADDDPYVPLRRSREIAKRLGAPLQIIPGGKHLNAETGMTAFPELAADLDALLAKHP